jgi:hypothetical protein
LGIEKYNNNNNNKKFKGKKEKKTLANMNLAIVFFPAF